MNASEITPSIRQATRAVLAAKLAAWDAEDVFEEAARGDLNTEALENHACALHHVETLQDAELDLIALDLLA